MAKSKKTITNRGYLYQNFDLKYYLRTAGVPLYKDKFIKCFSCNAEGDTMEVFDKGYFCNSCHASGGISEFLALYYDISEDRAINRIVCSSDDTKTIHTRFKK